MSTADETAAGFSLVGERTPLRDLFRGVVRNRELVVTLARKDFFVRYRRASFGLAWAVALPLVQAAILAVVLTRFVRFETDAPYAIFVYAGTLAWSFFNGAVTTSSTAIVDNSAITSRIYFPRILLPLMSVTATIFGFLAGLPVLIALMLVTGTGIGPEIVLLVPGVVLLMLLAASLGATLSALHVYFRDIRFMVSAVLMPLFYVTPVFYPLDALDGKLRTFVSLNPVTGVVQLFRLAIGESSTVLWPVLVAVGWVLVLGTVGLVLQGRRDRVFADLL